MNSRKKSLISALCLGALFLNGPAMAEETGAEEVKPAADLNIDLVSQYVWRGYAFGETGLVIQPSLTASYHGLGFNLWGNLDSDVAGDNQFNETDMTISYDFSAVGLDFGLGYIYYGLDGVDDSQEVYLSVAKDVLLAPSLAIYRDMDDFPGWYISASVGHAISFSDDLALDLGLKLSYLMVDEASTTADTDGKAYSAPLDGVFSVSMSFPVEKYITVTPMLNYSFALGSDAKDLLEAANVDTADGDANILYGGISLNMAF